MKSILLIEDNVDVRESAAELLNLEGFNMITTDCGENALELAEEHLPDIIICDILMPGMSGYNVCATLRQINREIPFIFMTAKSENADRQKAKDIGVENYLIKPFDGYELINCINKCLQVGNEAG